MVNIMHSKMCVFNNMVIRNARWGSEVVYKSTFDGAEGEPIKEYQSNDFFRCYTCTNCGNEFSTFDKARDHLGKKHELVDPFIIKKVTP